MNPGAVFPITSMGDAGLTLAAHLHALNARLWDRLAQQQLDAMALQIDAAVKQLRLLSQAHDVNDIIAGQTQLSQEYAEHLAHLLRGRFSLLVMVQEELDALAGAPARGTDAVPGASPRVEAVSTIQTDTRPDSLGEQD